MTVWPSANPWLYPTSIRSVVTAPERVGSNRVSIVVTAYAPVFTSRPAPNPRPVTLARSPMNANVFFVITGTLAAAPTAAVPAPEKFPAMMSSFRVSSAATRTEPFAFTTASEPMNARVVTSMTETPAFTLTATLPPPPAPTAIERKLSLDVASTMMLPEAETFAMDPIQASVVFVGTSTSMPRPTPAVPPIAIWPAIPLICVVSVAVTATFPPEVTLVLWSMNADVLFDMTSTTTAPATPAVPPAAPLTDTKRMFSVCVADTVRPLAPFARISARLPMAATTVPLRTKMIAATPTPAELPTLMFPDAKSNLSAVSLAITSMFPPAWTRASSSIRALVPPLVAFRTTTRIDPATAALVDAPPATTSSKSSSRDVALTVTSPPALTLANFPIDALTSFVMTSTTTERPMPALPVVNPSAPLTFVSLVWSSATTAIVCAAPPAVD